MLKLKTKSIVEIRLATSIRLLRISSCAMQISVCLYPLNTSTLEVNLPAVEGRVLAAMPSYLVQCARVDCHGK